MGFLDLFDDPNAMSALLGIPPQSVVPSPIPKGGIGSDYAAAPSAGYPTTAPVPQPRPQQTAMMPMPQSDPRAAAPTNSILPPSGNSGAGMDPATQAAMLNIPPSAVVDPNATMPPQMAPPLPPATNIGPMPRSGPGIPLPPTDPRAAAPQVAGNVPMPPVDPRAIPAAATPAMAAPNGVPLPPPSAGVPAPGAGGAGGLETQIGAAIPKGLSQGLQPANPFGQTMAAFGKGLSAVGSLPRGASVGQAIAAGAGGALTGGYQAQEQAKQQLFNNSSGAFKGLLAAQQTGDKQQIDAARAKLFNAQATAIMSGRGKTGTGGAWQNTPFGRVIQIENEVNKYNTQQRLQVQGQLGQMPDDQRQQTLANLDTKAEAYRNRLYKAAGIDPATAAKMRDAGTDQKNPIDTKGFSEDQFNAMVPMGSWYQATGADGKTHILQRTRPPAGAQPQPSAGVSPQENAAVLYNAGQE